MVLEGVDMDTDWVTVLRNCSHVAFSSGLVAVHEHTTRGG